MDDTGLRRRTSEEHLTELYERALRYLTHRSHSRLELRRKLLKFGAQEQVERLLNSLEDKGLLDDKEFAKQRAMHQRQRRRWGSYRIRQDLKKLGIDAKIIQHVLGQVKETKTETVSLQEVINLWIQKAQEPRSLSQIKKLHDHCLRLGYSSSLIRDQLKPYFQSLSWQSTHLSEE